MNATAGIFVCIAYFCIAVRANASGFRNLEFEDARPRHALPVTPDYVIEPTEELLPSWSLLQRNLVSGVETSWTYLGIDLIPPGGAGYGTLISRYFVSFLPLDGRYSVMFVPQPAVGSREQTEFDLYQGGLVPDNAQFVSLLVFGNGVRLFFDGNELAVSYTLIEERGLPGYENPVPLAWARADISSVAGTEGYLHILSRVDEGSAFDFSAIDRVGFEIVPEGDVVLLLVLGAGVLIFRRAIADV